MLLTTDFHSHVSRSSAMQMVQSAQERGLHILGLSEHVFQLNEGRTILPHMPQEGPTVPMAQYIEAVHAAAHEALFDARLGLEVDFVPEKNELIQTVLKGHSWDFLIGSVHEVDGRPLGMNDRTLTQEQSETRWQRYFALLRAAVNSGFFDVVSHPERMCEESPYRPSTLEQEYEQLAADAARHNVALEVNGYDVLRFPETVYSLLKACAIHRTPISVGSDAHYPRQVAQAHEQTKELLHKANITKVRIWRQRVTEEYKI